MDRRKKIIKDDGLQIIIFFYNITPGSHAGLGKKYPVPSRPVHASKGC